jgi:hypothetical protein
MDVNKMELSKDAPELFPEKHKSRSWHMLLRDPEAMRLKDSSISDVR